MPEAEAFSLYFGEKIGFILDKIVSGRYNKPYKEAERTVLAVSRPRNTANPLRNNFFPDAVFMRVASLCPRFFYLLWRCSTISKQELLINEEIREKEVRVVDSDGSQLGVIQTKDALAIAMEKNLDLVEIAPTANPHVCKIMDYGRYRFEQLKREKEAKKNQKTIEVKEVRLSLNIDTNDFNTKLNHAIKFLQDGNKVKVSVRFRGREMAHTELGTTMVQKFADGVAEFGAVDKLPKLEGRSMVMFITSKTAK